MSHFISGVDLQGVLIFHQMPTEIIKPKIKHYLNSNKLQQFFDRKGEEKIIDHVCQRFSKIQLNQLKIQKQLFIHQKCETLKKKFKSAFNPRADGKSVQNFFQRDNLSMESQINRVSSSLGVCTRKVQPKIQLQRKYNSTIKIKMMSIEEAKTINKQKEEYNSWLNQNNNCTQSPNLNKMLFLFERIHKQSKNPLKKIHKSIKTQPNCIQTPQLFKQQSNFLGETTINKENSSFFLRDNKTNYRKKMRNINPLHKNDEYSSFLCNIQ